MQPYIYVKNSPPIFDNDDNDEMEILRRVAYITSMSEQEIYHILQNRHAKSEFHELFHNVHIVIPYN